MVSRKKYVNINITSLPESRYKTPNHNDVQRVHRIYGKAQTTIEGINEGFPEKLKAIIGKIESHSHLLKFQILYPYKKGKIGDHEGHTHAAIDVEYYPAGNYDEELPDDINREKPLYYLNNTFFTNRSEDVINELERILRDDVRPTLEMLAGDW